MTNHGNSRCAGSDERPSFPRIPSPRVRAGSKGGEPAGAQHDGIGTELVRVGVRGIHVGARRVDRYAGREQRAPHRDENLGSESPTLWPRSFWVLRNDDRRILFDARSLLGPADYQLRLFSGQHARNKRHDASRVLVVDFNRARSRWRAGSGVVDHRLDEQSPVAVYDRHERDAAAPKPSRQLARELVSSRTSLRPRHTNPLRRGLEVLVEVPIDASLGLRLRRGIDIDNVAPRDAAYAYDDPVSTRKQNRR